ncbi:MAG: hypothetical protein AAF335_03255 [Bacteroidota bacterium]
MVEDKENEVPVGRARDKIVKYPEVLMLYRRELKGSKHLKRLPIDFEEEMTLDGNNYHLAGVTYYTDVHYWSHVKSIDDGQ